MHQSFPTQRRAFTMIELLVVVAILAVMVAMLLPVISQVRNSAKTTLCQGNQRQLGAALMAYASVNRQIIPTSYSVGGIVDSGKYWMWFLAQDPAPAPAVAGKYRQSGGTVVPAKPGEYGGTTLKCPNNAKYYGVGAFNGPSYAVMINDIGDNGGFKTEYTPGFSFRGTRIAAIKSPSTWMLAIDSGTSGVGISTLRLYQNQVMPGIASDIRGRCNRGGTEDRVWLAHAGNTANVLFYDGHVENCGMEWIIQKGIVYYYEFDGTCHIP